MNYETNSSLTSLDTKSVIANNHGTRINRKYARDESLKRTLFKGIMSEQIVATKEGVELTAQATPQFIKEISIALKNQVVLFEGLGRNNLGSDRVHLNKNVLPSVQELLKQIAEANRVITLKFNEVSGVLGNPISELEFGAKDGFYKKYERGAIYLSPKGIAHEVHGAIYQRYLSLRAEAGFLGYPETDEQATALGTGRFNHFQGGSIYWSPATGAWEIHGAIRDKWFALFADRSWLGFPISNEENFEGNTGRISHFQNGNITFFWSDSSVMTTSDTVFLQTALSASSVHCNLQFTMNSSGDWSYKGHMHNSGFMGFNVTVLTTLKFQNGNGDIFGVNVERHLDGTTSLGDDRSDDWDQVGKGEQFIIDNWETLRFAGIHSVMDVDVTLGDVVQVVFDSFPFVVGALIFGALIAGGSACPPRTYLKRNPRTGEDEPAVGIEIVGPNETCPVNR